MNAGRAVYGILSTNTEITDIVDTRIYPEIAEQEAPVPFIVYQIQNVAPEDTHDGPSTLDEVRIEFLCYDATYNGSAELGDKVRGALDRVQGTYNAVNVQSVQFNDVDTEIIDEPRRYAQVLTFTFRIARNDFEIAQGTPVTGAKLGDLYDVDTTGVTDGQVIKYNTATEEWLPATDAGGAEDLNDLTDVSYNPGTIQEGQVLAYEAQGQIFTATTIDTASSLDELTDVTIDHASVDQVLQYDGADWVNATFNTATSLEDLTDVDLTVSIPNGALLIYNNNTGLWSNTNSERLPSDGVYFHQRYQTESEALRTGATATTELYFTCTADGNGLAESASSDTPTGTNTGIRRKIYYSDAGFADPDTGTWVEFLPAPADDATFVTVKAALLENLKARTGGTVPISLKQTWEEIPEATDLLDTYTGAAAGYSLRRLKTGATNAIRVRRSSDNTEQDIGFVDGELDTVSLLAFVGTAVTDNGYVKTWYDQSGNSNDATQTATGQQPQIVSSGAVIVENGKPAIQWPANLYKLNVPALGLTKQAVSAFIAVQGPVSNWNNVFGDLAGEFRLYNTNNGKTGFFYNQVLYGDIARDNNYKIISMVAGSTLGGFRAWANNTPQFNLVSLSSGSIDSLQVGTLASGSSWNGHMHELIFYPTDQSTNRTGIEANINTFYNIF